MAQISEPFAGSELTEDQQVQELEETLASLRADSEVAHVLLGLAGVLGEVRSVEETLELAVQAVCEIFGADRCYAATTSEAGRTYVIAAHYGYEPDKLAVLREQARGEKGLPVLRRALAAGLPLFVPDAYDDPRVPIEMARAREASSFIALPLVRWGDEFGGLGLEFARHQEFGSKETALARGIGRVLGIALVNARRFNMFASLRSFGLSVARKLSLASVVEDVAWGAVELLGGESAKVYFVDSAHKTLVEAGAFEDEPSADDPLARIDLHEEPWNQLLEGRAVVVSNVDTEDAPRSVVAAPIPGEQSPILGAVAVFFRRQLASSPEEVEALYVLAGQAGMAVENANRFERQRQVTRSLQEGLLSSEMPKVEGCLTSALYEPASGDKDIGGDFYDMFELPDGRFALAVGDVSGKGAEAAARTAMVKYMMRAFATSNSSPADLMSNLNEALCRDLEADRFATLVYGVLDQGALKFTLARAGHPPPLLYRAEDESVEALEETIEGAVLGCIEGEVYTEASFALSPGDVFLLYTDGLIEARSDQGFYGRRRIEESLKRHAPELEMEKLVRRIYSETASFGTINDDVVVFALQCPRDS